jgi:hypothetical protein
MAYNFPDTPTIGQVYSGYVWNGESWQVQGATASGAVRYDTPQGLNANQQAQARSNVGVTKKNYIINGAMMVSQENGATAVAVGYPVDQFQYVSTTGVVSAAQVASRTPGGSPNRLRCTVTTADASVAAGDIAWLMTKLEGLRTADLNLGASAKTITLQFGVKAPAGTYCVSFFNAVPNRTYTAEYVIAAGEANTDVIKSVVVALDTTGTWASDNTMGLQLNWMLMAGTTYQMAANTWSANANGFATSSQFNFMGTNGNVFELFDVSLTEGTVAPPFQVPDYASELAACKRYYQKVTGGLQMAVSNNASYYSTSYMFSVAMRAAPTVARLSDIAIVGFLTPFAEQVTADGWRATAQASVSGSAVNFHTLFSANARL